MQITERNGRPGQAIGDNIGDDREAAELRGFGPIGVLAILVILAGNFLFPPLSAILVLIWLGLSHTPWRAIGFVRPDSWIRTAAIGIVLGVALKFLLKTIVMPLLGAPPVNAASRGLHSERSSPSPDGSGWSCLRTPRTTWPRSP